MNAMNLADKLVSISRICILSALIALPLNAQAEYYLVYEAPPCYSCYKPRPCYRPVHKVHKAKVHKAKPYKKCHRPVYRKRSHYNVSVYYPVPTSTQNACGSGCDGGFLAPTYRWSGAPYNVYYTHPKDRLVGNRYEDNYYHDPSLDTGTADNDIY